MPSSSEIQAQVIGVAEHPFKHQASIFQAVGFYPPTASQGFYQPEGTQVKGALQTIETIGIFFNVVAVDQVIGQQSPFFQAVG